MIWIKQNPDSFELIVRKNLKSMKGEIDFANPRILCFAQEYNIDDKCLALSLGAELWKYRYYENESLVISKEEEPEQLIKTKSKEYKIEKIKKEHRVAKTVEQHLIGASGELKDLFERLDMGIKDISSEIERYTTNAEIIYTTSRNFVYMAVQNKNNCLRLQLRTTNDTLIDSKNLTKPISKTHGYGNITRQMHISPKDETEGKFIIEDILDIINQSYDSTQ